MGVEFIVIHCTETSVNLRITEVDDYRDYHYIIGFDGECWGGKRIDDTSETIHICYVGGIDCYGNKKDTRTQKQRQTLWFLLKDLKYKFPEVKIIGHNDIEKNVSCPNFNVKQEYHNI